MHLVKGENIFNMNLLKRRRYNKELITSKLSNHHQEKFIAFAGMSYIYRLYLLIRSRESHKSRNLQPDPVVIRNVKIVFEFPFFFYKTAKVHYSLLV